jgi:hypothetical protein
MEAFVVYNKKENKHADSSQNQEFIKKIYFLNQVIFNSSHASHPVRHPSGGFQPCSSAIPAFESRPPSTMRTSDSHTVVFPPPLLLYGKTLAVAPDNKVPVWASRVPDTSLHTCHALSPRQVSEVSPMRLPVQFCCTCVDFHAVEHVITCS